MTYDQLLAQGERLIEALSAKEEGDEKELPSPEEDEPF